MSWREQLREGSFRGAPFKVEGHDLEGGRRAAIFEFPQRDDPVGEDLGRRARQMSLDLFVIGDDYMADRDRLIDAFETAGSGTLVHPYLGTRTVQVLSFRVRESTEEGGLARFQLTCIQVAATPAVQTRVDTAVTAKVAALALDQTAKTSFQTRFRTLTFPSFVELDALNVLDLYVSAVRRLAYRLTGQGAALYALSRQLQALEDDGAAKVRAPADLTTAMADIAAATGSLALTSAEALSAQAVLLTFGADLADIPGTSPARRRQRENRAAFLRLARQLAASQAIQAAADLEFDSYQSAAKARDALADQLDDLVVDVADAGDDAAYLSLQAARAAMIRDITARGGSLARLYDYRPLQTEPALVIANRLYGDASREAEIVTRNAIAHPGFVQADVALEVLSDA